MGAIASVKGSTTVLERLLLDACHDRPPAEREANINTNANACLHLHESMTHSLHPDTRVKGTKQTVAERGALERLLYPLAVQEPPHTKEILA